jgi:hypothetical protein
MELTCQPQSRGFFQEFRTHKQVGSLALTNVEGLTGRAHRSGQMAILAQPLGQDGAKGGVGVNNENPSRMAAVINFIRLSHKSLI